MTPEALAACAGLFVLLSLVVIAGVLAIRANRQGEADAAAERDGAAVPLRPAGQGRMGRRNLRQRPRRVQQADEEEEEGVEGEEERDYTGMTRAERRAAERENRRLAGEAAREAQQAQQEAKDAKRKAYDDRRRQKEEEREAAEEAALEELKRAEQERLRREEEEAAKWLHLIAVEGEGQDNTEDGDGGQGLLTQFINYIKDAKAVELDELAAEFRLPTSEAIKRVQALEEAGDLTGVMDDRGKFIYISRGEMEAVASFIKQRGRVSIAELAAKSNTFIDLDSKAVQRADAYAAGGEGADLDLGLDDVEE